MAYNLYINQALTGHFIYLVYAKEIKRPLKDGFSFMKWGASKAKAIIVWFWKESEENHSSRVIN